MFLSLSTSLCPHSLHYILTVVFSLNLSPQSSVQAAISGHPVTIATLATLGHKTAGAHSGLVLAYPVSLSLRSLCGIALFLSLFSAQMQRRQFHFVPSHLHPHVILYIQPCISHSFVTFICHPVCLCVCQETSCNTVVESWQSRLSCGVSRCQTYQSFVPTYLPVSDDDKSAQLVLRGRIVLCHPRHSLLFVCLHLTSNPRQTKVSLSEVLAFKGV